MPRSECREDQAGEHEIDAYELHGCSNGEREQRVEIRSPRRRSRIQYQANNTRALMIATGSNCSIVHPKHLPDEQFLEVFAAVRIAGKNKDAGRCGENKGNADQSFLYLAGQRLSVQCRM